MYIKVASVSMNQTVYDYATNVHNFKCAIDRAVDDEADILATEELSLVGYPADDYHQWNKDNDRVWSYVSLLADYAKARNPNLILTVGFPWHYADKALAVTDPAYNITNRPFNVHAAITNGKVVSVWAKSILADGPAEYEPRQFNDWPLVKGTISIELPDGSVVPFGKPVLSFGQFGRSLTLMSEICAEGWPGLHDDLTIDCREQAEARHIVAMAKRHDLSVVLNPSASKPQTTIQKEMIRAKGLCLTGAKCCGLYVYTNFLGSASGTYAAEGSQIFARDDNIIHHGQRYSFKNVSYSSVVVDLPQSMRGAPDAYVPHHFIAHEIGAKVGREAVFDAAFTIGSLSKDQLVYEETMRSIALWLRDYLAKQQFDAQGYVISLSGGKDSAFGAVAITTMIDLEVQENGLQGFFEHFPLLKYKDDVLRLMRAEGQKKAVSLLKKNFLTCVYLPTENSSDRTLRSASELVNGGIGPEGAFTGVGGKFFVAPVQGILEEALIAFTGLNLTSVAKTCTDEILGTDYRDLPSEDREVLARAKAMRVVRAYINAEHGAVPQLPSYIIRHCINPLPSWANPADDITLQNIQARVRVSPPWAIANQEGKIALVTSNETENALGYSTAGGDAHMGGANPLGGVPKALVTDILKYMEQNGLCGLAPVPSLYWVNAEAPSAELRRSVEGAPAQTDEGDLGFSYTQSQFIEKYLIIERGVARDVLALMQESPLFGNDLVANRDILVRFTKRWGSAQFKRVFSALSPHIGFNVDPHQSVRTTVLGDHFRTDCACMTLSVVQDVLGGAEPFAAHFGVNLAQAQLIAGVDNTLKRKLIDWSIDTICDPVNAELLLKTGKEEGLLLPERSFASLKAGKSASAPIPR